MMTPMGTGARAAIAAGLVALVAATAGCSWRLESDPVPFRTPSPSTVIRDGVAAAESAVDAAAQGSTDVLGEVESVLAPTRVAALGGVSPTSSPRPSADLAAAIAAASDQASECAETTDDPTLGGLCASIVLSHALVTFAADPAPRGEPQVRVVDETAAVIPDASTQVDPQRVAEWALAHDRARAMYETIAARAVGDERNTALARGRLHRDRVAQLLGTGVEDLTQLSYDVPAARVVDTAARVALASETELALAEDYAAAMVTAAPVDRAWLTNAAYDAYAASSLAPDDVPALPGVAAE